MESSLKNMSEKKLAAVVIGRNEGARLIQCLDSLLKFIPVIVYVDSGSTDDSLSAAKNLEVETISLDMSIPFTAARARNTGAAYLLKKYPDLDYIQFVDGDCVVQADWPMKSLAFLEGNDEYAVVCGRRRERYPERTILNYLCDIEWNSPIGDALSCGGDALIRAGAFHQVGGFNDTLIAGEEPEMCFRLRQKGWKIRRLDAEMTMHDANMTSISQWWNRSKRAGYAYIEGYFFHGRSKEKYRLKPTVRTIFWALVLPVMIFGLSILNINFLLFLIIYPMQIARLTIQNQAEVSKDKYSFFYALSNVVGKFPEFLGMMRFVINKCRGRKGTLIEYK